MLVSGLMPSLGRGATFFFKKFLDGDLSWALWVTLLTSSSFWLLGAKIKLVLLTLDPWIILLLIIFVKVLLYFLLFW